MHFFRVPEAVVSAMLGANFLDVHLQRPLAGKAGIFRSVELEERQVAILHQELALPGGEEHVGEVIGRDIIQPVVAARQRNLDIGPGIKRAAVLDHNQRIRLRAVGENGEQILVSILPCYGNDAEIYQSLYRGNHELPQIHGAVVVVNNQQQ